MNNNSFEEQQDEERIVSSSYFDGSGSILPLSSTNFDRINNSHYWTNGIINGASFICSFTLGGLVYTCVYTTITSTGATVGVSVALIIKSFTNGIVNILYYSLPNHLQHTTRWIEYGGYTASSIIESTTIASTDQTAAFFATIAGTATGYFSNLFFRRSFIALHHVLRSKYVSPHHYYSRFTKRQTGYNATDLLWNGHTDLLESGDDEWYFADEESSSSSRFSTLTEKTSDNDTEENNPNHDDHDAPPFSDALSSSSSFFFYPMNKYTNDTNHHHGKTYLNTITLSPVKSSDNITWWIVHSPTSTNTVGTPTLNHNHASTVSNQAWVILPSIRSSNATVQRFV